MIDFGGTLITSLTLGTDPIVAIYFGNTKVWPSGTITTAITNVHLVYSSGSQIDAAGSNYASIQGTLITYLNGTEQSRTTVSLSPILYSGDSSIWYSDGTQIKAQNRGTTTGSTRSSSWKATYGSYTSGTFTVSQAANTRSINRGAITSFVINGDTGVTIQIDYKAQTLPITSLAGYRVWRYSSGEEFQESCSISVMDDQDWLTANTSYITVSEYTDYDEDEYAAREATITAYDTMHSSTRATRTIYQGAKVYELTVPTSKSIGSTVTGFYIEVYSYYMGNAFPITSSMVSFGSNPSNCALSSISTVSAGRYRLFFTCSANTVTTIKNSYIIITQTGGETKTCRIIQEAYSEYVDGIDIYAEDGDWVLGTVTVGSGTTDGITYYVRTPIVARKQENDEDVQVNIDKLIWQDKVPVSGAVPTGHTDTDISFEIYAGDTVALKPLGGDVHYYYGALIPTDSYPGGILNRPDFQLNYATGFSVTY